ncbi:MAG: thermonuclease family protein [Planctomycetota bacterium]
MPHPPLGVTARGLVVRVIDGDTLEVMVHWPLRIRMKDCWAPETRGEERPEGLKSKAKLEELLPPGEPIVFNIDSEDAHSLGDLLTFGRVVGLVWRPDDSMSVSEIMVGSGFATETKQ